MVFARGAGRCRFSSGDWAGRQPWWTPGPTVDLAWVLDDLHGRGVRRLMVEGGRRVLTQLLAGGLADELQLVVAPVFVGDARAPRFVDDGPFPCTAPNRAPWPRSARWGTPPCCATP